MHGMWYFEKDGQTEGPVTFSVLNSLVAQQVIKSTTLLLPPQGESWVRADTVFDSAQTRQSANVVFPPMEPQGGFDPPPTVLRSPMSTAAGRASTPVRHPDGQSGHSALASALGIIVAIVAGYIFYQRMAGNPRGTTDPSPSQRSRADEGRTAESPADHRARIIRELNSQGEVQATADMESINQMLRMISGGHDPSTAFAYGTSGQTSEIARDQLAARLIPTLEQMRAQIQDPVAIRNLDRLREELERRKRNLRPANGSW